MFRDRPAARRRAGKPPEWPFRSPVVSAEFRQEVGRRISGFDTDSALRGLVATLLFPTLCDRETGLPLLSAGLLASIEGKEREYRSKRYRGGDFLARVRENAIPGLEWSAPVWRWDAPGRCRTATSSGLPEMLHRLAYEEVSVPLRDRGQCVDFVCGGAFGERLRARLRREEQEEAIAPVSSAGSSPTAYVASHLNANPPNLYTRAINRRIEEAYVIARAAPEPNRAVHALRTLRAVERQPQPFYAPSRRGCTPRVFGVGASMLTLPRDARKVLTRDWVSLDLVSAHLAIASRLWDVPRLASELESGASVWPTLVSAMGPAGERTAGDPSTPEFLALKALAKRTLYSLVYGAGRKRLMRFGLDEDEWGPPVFGLGDPEEAARRLLRHPWMEKSTGLGREPFPTWCDPGARPTASGTASPAGTGGTPRASWHRSRRQWSSSSCSPLLSLPKRNGSERGDRGGRWSGESRSGSTTGCRSRSRTGANARTWCGPSRGP